MNISQGKVMTLAMAQEPRYVQETVWTAEKKRLLKSMICKDATDDQLLMFIDICNRTKLDPFNRQIYFIMRGGQMTIQTSIEGLRLIADRTGRYSPWREPSYVFDDDGKLVSATSYIRKQTADGTWHEVASTAYFEEYNANTTTWKKFPRVMLAKCAESGALRKAFPAEMCGVYSQEEMDQADAPLPVAEVREGITEEEYERINDLIGEDEAYRKTIMVWLKESKKITNLRDVDRKTYYIILDRATKKFAEEQKNKAIPVTPEVTV